MNRRIFLSLLPSIPLVPKLIAKEAMNPPMVIRIMKHPMFSIEELYQQHLISVREAIRNEFIYGVRVVNIEDIKVPPRWWTK